MKNKIIQFDVCLEKHKNCEVNKKTLDLLDKLATNTLEVKV